MSVCRLLVLPRFLSQLSTCRFRGVRQASGNDVMRGNSEVELFDKILIANRGEIACRVMRTAKQLGVESVVVYSEADRDAMHVAMADEAYCIGPPPSSESYLRQDKIMEVALATGAKAIHPGYGFLSENKKFAELCEANGVEFIGPPASAIEKMGAKRLSKSIMSSSSVPVVPGYFGDDQSDAKLQEEAAKLGYPVMLKADLGGGGKGMRVVWAEEEFSQALQACRSEAMKSFDDDKVMVEKFVDKPRHVEVQIFGDKYGNTVHLFERDCSVQRRHQKIIEEAPAPGLHPTSRERICAAAVRAAEAVGYVGAGTVEFILDQKQEFYFMEMNTRLQVEHPITEMITGVDLVEWQLKVAAGAPLPLTQQQLKSKGHAFEARIYAENPEKGFIPSPGLLHHLVTPTTTPTVRVDSGVRQGDMVTTYYDPMIAKLVVWATNRKSALHKLYTSLTQYQVAGVNTNIGFLERLSSHKGFQDGDVHTGFIQQHEKDLFPVAGNLSGRQQSLATVTLLALEEFWNTNSTTYTNDPHSPFNEVAGGRINSAHTRPLHFSSGDKQFKVQVQYNGLGEYLLTSGDQGGLGHVSGHIRQEEGGSKGAWHLRLDCVVEDSQVSANVAVVGDQVHIFTKDERIEVHIPKPSFQDFRSKIDEGGVRSPSYPTSVTKVYVKVGEEVKKMQTLVTLEGMKTETSLLPL